MDNRNSYLPLLLDFQGLNLTIATIVRPLGLLATNWQKNYLGNVKRELKLNFGNGTEVYYSCGATLNGQNWIIGGGNYPDERQVSDLSDNHI